MAVELAEPNIGEKRRDQLYNIAIKQDILTDLMLKVTPSYSNSLANSIKKLTKKEPISYSYQFDLQPKKEKSLRCR